MWTAICLEQYEKKIVYSTYLISNVLKRIFLLVSVQFIIDYAITIIVIIFIKVQYKKSGSQIPIVSSYRPFLL